MFFQLEKVPEGGRVLIILRGKPPLSDPSCFAGPPFVAYVLVLPWGVFHVLPRLRWQISIVPIMVSLLGKVYI